jgi:[protein-PII] uridylyltransferase
MKPEPEKILDRAEERLRKLPQSDGEETLNLLRGFLRMESHRLRMLHRYGVGGMEVALGHSQVVDALIAHLYRLSLERYPAPRFWGGKSLDVAIVAVGGYGRGELSPYSDVDLLILYDRSSAGFARHLAQELIYLLWDIGLKVGHSWRTPDDCLEMARADSSVENSLLDARYLIGEQRVWECLCSLLQRHWAKNIAKFVERKRMEVEERYGRLGETVFLQEPNVKESPGGLRDYHTILWLARGAWLLPKPEALVGEGVLSEDDWQRARRAYDSVMRVRNELHYLTGRRADQLTLSLQAEVAANLQFRPAKHLLAAEVFMRDYFQHAENLHRAMRMTLAAALRQKGRKTPLAALDSPLPLVRTEDELRLREIDGRFPSSPLEMMQAVNLAQKLGLRLGESVKNAIRSNLAALGRVWQRSPEMGACFLEMLRRPGQVGLALRSMHSCGLLGKYLPEFARVTRLMQADYYHRYTTDEHTLRAIELLDEIWRKPPPSLERYRELTYHIPDTAPLYLGLLCHDIGKGLGGGHSEKGAQRAVAISERLGLPREKIAQVELLVRQHLLLSHLSQRRDLLDHRVAQGAAAVVGDLETLSMLTLMTYADTAAVGPEIWTEWKNVLLWELYTAVHDEFLDLETASAQEEARLSEMRAQVQQLLQSSQPEQGSQPLTPELARLWMDEHLSLLPPRYPLGNRPEWVAKQIALAKRAARTGPAVDLIPVPEEGYTVLLLCCPDTSGLFARVAGTLASLEVNIRGAKLDTRKDGMAVDVIWISTPAGNVIADPAKLRRIGSTVEGVLKGTVPFEDLVARISVRPLAPALKSPQIILNNEISDRSTVLEILAEDRLGFAYSVAKCLTSLGLNIAFAKLSTEKTMVFDVFYLTDSSGRKLDESRWDEVIAALKTATEFEGGATVSPGWNALGGTGATPAAH